MGYTYTHNLTGQHGTPSFYDIVSAIDYNETCANLLAEWNKRMIGSVRAHSVSTNVNTIIAHEAYKCNDRSQLQNFFTTSLSAVSEVQLAFDMNKPIRITGLRMLPNKGYRYTELLWNGFTIWASHSSTNGFDGVWNQIGSTYYRSDNNFRWHEWTFDSGEPYRWYKIIGNAQAFFYGGHYITCACIEWISASSPSIPVNINQYISSLQELHMNTLLNSTKGLVNYWGFDSFPWSNPTYESWESVYAAHLAEVRQVIDDSLHGARCNFDCSAVCGMQCGAACTTSCGAGCAASCADGGCTVSCSSGCSGSCYAGCSLGCSNTCSVNCQGDCSTTCYTGCGGFCRTGCDGDCRGDYTCAGDCQNLCSGGCGGKCGGSCYGSCVGGCQWGCMNSCLGNCGNDCTGGCGNTCHATCGNNTCWNNCGMACSLHACSANCSGSCLFNCYTSCSSGCGTDCNTTARIGTNPGF